jgi:hypothetical protein
VSKTSIGSLSLAAALAALSSGAEAATLRDDPAAEQITEPGALATTRAGEPNVTIVAGENLLGFIVTEKADGTMVAEHYSHRSHSSHSSHSSHHSSRY